MRSRASGQDLRGTVDTPTPGAVVHGRMLVVRGWHRWRDEPVAAVAVEAAGTRVVVAPGNEVRLDVADAYDDPQLARCGWRAELDLSAVAPGLVDVVVTLWTAPDGDARRLAPIPVTLAPPTAGAALAGISGAIDRPLPGAEVGPRVTVAGWALAPGRPVGRVEIVAGGRGLGTARLGLARADLAAHSAEPHAVVAGFEHLVDLSDLPPGPVRIVARGWVDDAGPVDLAEQTVVLAEHAPDRPASRRDPAGRAARRAVLTGRRAQLRARPPAGGDLRLAVVAHSLQRRGAELWLRELLGRAGAGRRFPCRVLALEDGPVVDDLEAAGIEVQVVHGPPPPDLEAYEGRVTEVASWLAAGDHNALLVNTVVPWFAVDAAAELGIPVVWAVHESHRPDDLCSTLLEPFAVAPDVAATLPAALRRAHAVVFVSEATRDLYLDHVDPARALVVPYGIDLRGVDDYRRAVGRDDARRNLGVAPEAFLILSVGVLQPRKAQSLLVSAFAQVAADFPASRLAVIGQDGSPYGAAIAEYVRRADLEDRVHVVAETEDTAAWYRAADAFVCASDNESMPRTILEALTFGLPIAATSVFGIPELLTDGETGFLFPPRDLDALVAALRNLLTQEPDTLARVGAAGRALALDRLDSAEYAAAVVALLDGLRADLRARPADLLARAGDAGTPVPVAPPVAP
jgi:glycosyltransferase involved in cell wall biosynthesis